jgi:peptidyl-dipeptidase Dcp
MPQELVNKIKRSRTFNQGYAVTEYVAAALLDMAWHSLPPTAPQQDANKFESDALKRYQIDLPQVPPRYHTTYFSHIWDGGYSAGYYAYLWSEVLDDDAFYWFKEHGGMTRENGQRFGSAELELGGISGVNANSTLQSGGECSASSFRAAFTSSMMWKKPPVSLTETIGESNGASGG